MKTSETEPQERSSQQVARQQPGWLSWILMKGFRLLFLTVLWSGIGMGVGLLGGILVLMTIGAIHHQIPQMSLAYRDAGIPAAILCGGSALLWNLGRTVQAAWQRR